MSSMLSDLALALQYLMVLFLGPLLNHILCHFRNDAILIMISSLIQKSFVALAVEDAA